MGTSLCLCLLAFQPTQSNWTAGPPLPIPVTNNAVAAWNGEGEAAVFSFLGLDSTKLWSGVTNRAFRWSIGESGWEEIMSVPGPGRLAGTAQTVGDKIFVFGGYTVAEDGSETSVPNVDVYDPRTDTWTSAAPMPTPVDDAVSGLWRDSLIYLISGWHDRDNVSNVQIYDPATDTWLQATPIPGKPVFGHAGAIAGDAIVYVDGVTRNAQRPRYTIEPQSWRGDIDPSNPSEIAWTALPDHPGPPLYRAAATGLRDWVVIAGGTDNPYNYDGVGYNGVPSPPLDGVIGFNVTTGDWSRLPSLATPSMDHRGIVVVNSRFVIAGGMNTNQRVTTNVVTMNADQSSRQ